MLLKNMELVRMITISCSPNNPARVRYAKRFQPIRCLGLIMIITQERLGDYFVKSAISSWVWLMTILKS